MLIRNLFVAATAAAAVVFATANTASAAAWVPAAGATSTFTYSGGLDTDGEFGTPVLVDSAGFHLEPASFRAVSVGGSPDIETDTLKVTVNGINLAKTITKISLSELGDYAIDNGGGVQAFAGIFVRVLDADWGFSTRVYYPSDASTSTFAKEGTPSGTGFWSLNSVITLPAAARSVSITLNNTVQAHSNVAGSALIQKKEVDILINQPLVPEPTTVSVILGGLGFGAARRRKA